MSSKLTEKQRKFVEAYMGKANGNATEAARLAGYSGNRVTLEAMGRENLGKPRIAEAIKNRQSNDPLVATREERQKFWTDVMNDKAEDMRNRLRASEILGKASGDFIERIDHTSGGKELSTINVVIHRASASD